MQHGTLDPDGLSSQKEAIHFKADISTNKKKVSWYKETHLLVDHKFR